MKETHQGCLSSLKLQILKLFGSFKIFLSLSKRLFRQAENARHQAGVLFQMPRAFTLFLQDDAHKNAGMLFLLAREAHKMGGNRKKSEKI